MLYIDNMYKYFADKHLYYKSKIARMGTLKMKLYFLGS